MPSNVQYGDAWYNGAMLSNSNKKSLHQRPSRLYTLGEPVGANWDEALRFVVELKGDLGPLLSKYYHSLPTVCRPSAAQEIASSAHCHSMKSPDAAYIEAWLLVMFYQGRRHLRSSDDPRMDLSHASVLSNWLKENPDLLPCLVHSVSKTFFCSGAYTMRPYQMDALLNRTVARKYRTSRFYTEMLRTTPTLLNVCAKHIDEHTALETMGDEHCQYVARLAIQWQAVYPQSTLAPKINGLLSTMNSLEQYNADFLRQGLGMQATPEVQTIALPDAFAPL